MGARAINSRSLAEVACECKLLAECACPEAFRTTTITISVDYWGVNYSCTNFVPRWAYDVSFGNETLLRSVTGWFFQALFLFLTSYLRVVFFRVRWIMRAKSF